MIPFVMAGPLGFYGAVRAKPWWLDRDPRPFAIGALRDTPEAAYADAVHVARQTPPEWGADALFRAQEFAE